MKVLSWNVRGLGRSRTVKRLKNKLRVINPRILFLMEIKLSSKKMELGMLKCGFENRIDVGAIGARGGLSLGWKVNALVQLKSFSSYHIDVEVHDNECGDTWRLTGFYGNPDERCRAASWDLLRQLNHGQVIPWVVLGDFNEITSSFEKKGGRLRSDRQMRDFRRALEDCNLNDLIFVGRWFTWERGRFASTIIRERLDRGVSPLSWVNLFPGYRLEHLSHSFSDHCPLLLDTLGMAWNNQNGFAKAFRFETKWCLDSSFEGLVRKWWEKESGGVLNKLEKMGHQMLKWSKATSSKERRNRRVLEDRLSSLYDQDPSDEILAEILEVQVGLNQEVDKEELFWEQRARVNWLRNGDRNTSFFSQGCCATTFSW